MGSGLQALHLTAFLNDRATSPSPAPDCFGDTIRHVKRTSLAHKGSPLRRAAQYVRMSAEHHQFSIENRSLGKQRVEWAVYLSGERP